MFALTLVNLNSLAHESIICEYNRNKPITDILYPLGCYNLSPAIDWVRRYTLSIFIVFFIAFIPIVIQELIERGLWKATQRFFKHICSLSPMFEVFSGQIFSNALLSDMTYGGARYISTGRGFATSRIPFSILYSRFAGSAIYMGSRTLLMIFFGSVAHWQPALLWFWASLSSLMFSPFIFNPHQFSKQDYFIDYRDFIRWLSRGNGKFHRNSWIGYVRMSRARVTGFKKKLLGDESEKTVGDVPRAHKSNVLMAEFVPCAIYAAGCFVAFTFINAQTGVRDAVTVNSAVRVIICTLGPIVINMGVLFFTLGLSCCAGPLLHMCCKKTGPVMAGFAHGISVIVALVFFIVMWVLEGFSFPRMLIGQITCIFCQRLIFIAMSSWLLTREFKNDHANSAFWTGRWYGSGMGGSAWTQPTREFTAKVIEMSEFAADFILGHLLLFCQLPLVLMPFIDKFHSIMLFWLKPSRQIRAPIYSLKQSRLRKRMVKKYSVLYAFVLILFVIVIAAPAVASSHVSDTIGSSLTGTFKNLVQPRHQNNNDTGKKLSTWKGHYLSHTPSLKTWSTKKP
ncbi:unnamed protein product [Hanseniaspora opuntiae]